MHSNAAFTVSKDLLYVKSYLSALPHKGLVMSGSGSTYILFSDKNNSEYIYNELKKNKEWFIFKEEVKNDY